MRCCTIILFYLPSALAFNFGDFGIDSEDSDGEDSSFDFGDESEDLQDMNPFGTGMQGFGNGMQSDESSEEASAPGAQKFKLETDEIPETKESSEEEETAKRVVRSIKKKKKNTPHHKKKPKLKKRKSTTISTIKKSEKSKSKNNNTVTNTAVVKTTTKKNIIAKFTSNGTLNKIFIDPQQIKHLKEFKNLTADVLSSGLKVFESIKNKTTNYMFKSIMDDLAKIYKRKYEEFLKEAGELKIKTRLGTQKAILNAVDTSNHILRRLVNHAVDAMDRDGLLQYNLKAANNFHQEVNAEINLEYTKVCEELGVCRTEGGFPNFLDEVITIILQCDDEKLKAIMDSLTEGAKDEEFNGIFKNKTQLYLEIMIDRVEKRSIRTIRPYLKIIKNILMNKNRPLIIAEAGRSEINSTLGILEILDALEEKIPRNDANIIVWGDFRTNLTDWIRGQRSDIQDIMGRIFLNMIKTAFQEMPKTVKDHVEENFERVVL